MTTERTARLRRLLEPDGREREERENLVALMGLLADLPPPPDPLGLFARYEEYHDAFLRSVDGDDWEALEEAFLTLYAHLHGHEAPYTAEERRVVDHTGGYWCHAGGLSPVLKAPGYLHRESIAADFGAGNGLQGLLMQRLAPHRRTVQIELSSRMVEAGRHLQAWLSVPTQRVEWVVGDVLDASPVGLDFVYLYRPVRPDGVGRGFYERFAEAVAASANEMVIFSVADCLGAFLPPGADTFYDDGHLTCFRWPGSAV